MYFLLNYIYLMAKLGWDYKLQLLGKMYWDITYSVKILDYWYMSCIQNYTLFKKKKKKKQKQNILMCCLFFNNVLHFINQIWLYVQSGI